MDTGPIRWLGYAVLIFLVIMLIYTYSNKIQFLIAGAVGLGAIVYTSSVFNDIKFGGDYKQQSLSDVCMLDDTYFKQLKMNEADVGYRKEEIVLKTLNCAINDKAATDSHTTLLPLSDKDIATHPTLSKFFYVERYQYDPETKQFSDNHEKVYLSLDGYGEFGYNKQIKLAVEYQGEQHYALTSMNTLDTYIRQRFNDYQKYLLCQKYGIQLIEIPYMFWSDRDYILSRLQDALQSALRDAKPDAYKSFIAAQYRTKYKYIDEDIPVIDGAALITNIDKVGHYTIQKGTRSVSLFKYKFRNKKYFDAYLLKAKNNDMSLNQCIYKVFEPG